MSKGCYTRLFNARKKLLEFSVYAEIVDSSFHVMHLDWDHQLTRIIYESIQGSTLCPLNDTSVRLVSYNGTHAVAFVITFKVVYNARCDNLLLSHFSIRRPFTFYDSTEIVTLKLYLYEETEFSDSYFFLKLADFKNKLKTFVVVKAPFVYCPFITLNQTQLCLLSVLKEKCDTEFSNHIPKDFVVVHNLREVKYQVCVQVYLDFVNESLIPTSMSKASAVLLSVPLILLSVSV